MQFRRELVDPAGVPINCTVGVVVSGGFDSTVLWHIVFGICQERGQKCIPFTVPKNDGAFHYAGRMLEWSSDYHQTKRRHPWPINADAVTWNREEPEQGHEVQSYLTGGIAEIIKEGYADVVFVGVNEYPPNHEELCDYHTPGPRGLSRDSDAEWQGRKAKDVILNPFADLTKDKIVKLADQLGILEQVSELTHSCVELKRGRCGKCFWCKERKWAFKEAGLTDPGLN